jgi:thioredoxin-like negative regulator of GroEL
MNPVLLRTLLAIGIVLLGLFAYSMLTRLLLRRRRNSSKGLEAFIPGTPAILYFTTPTCVPCITQQRPALKKLTDEWGLRVQVFQVDASERPDIADYWGVLSVPTTFVFNSKGEARAMNHGVASADKLRRQLEDAQGGPLVGAGDEEITAKIPASAEKKA